VTTKKFEVPEWMPAAVRENRPDTGGVAGATVDGAGIPDER